MKNPLLLFSLLALQGIGICCLGQLPIPQLHWSLVWEDQFDEPPLDTSLWCRNDWRALQYNRHDLRAFRTDPLTPPDNLEWHNESNGSLKYVRQIVKKEPRARKVDDIQTPTIHEDTLYTFEYTAPAWLISKTRFKYGYYETRCRLPLLDANENNLGFGANFWLWRGTPILVYPESEIDVVEFVCDFPPHTHTCNVHHKTIVNTYGWHDFGSTRLTPNDGAFHTYGAWWGPDFVKFYIDGVFYRDARYDIPLLADEMIPMHIILDINVFTVRGNETPNANTKIPYNYDIDYVRVYQLDMEQCNLDYINVSPMPALPSVYRTITFGGNGSSMPNGSTKSLTANTSITIQPGFEAPLGAELTMDIYPYCHPNIVQPCSTCTDCD
jgi:beta-glucanase (GH16 family)